jgi:poly-gamma-glutamate synthesis protein (capsule biosynthesis protein)
MSGTTLFLCGDVMTGRGIDQILPNPGDPAIFETWVRDARDYVALAEAANGEIPRQVAPLYIWGDAAGELDRRKPAATIVNLETSITQSGDYERGKGINYRMHPGNLACLLAPHLDVCVLANNHTMDYGVSGLRETLQTLGAAGVRTAGAGETREQAEAPAMVAAHDCRIVVFAFGTKDSGIPPWWAAGDRCPGVSLLDDLEAASAERIAARVQAVRRAGDIVVASIHWGSNWGYEVPPEQVAFARRLVEQGVDLVHGHSSHHPRPVDVWNGRLILYGCGDFINDYEGIGGYEPYRGDLVLMYFVTLTATGELVQLEAVPMQIRNMRLNRPSAQDTEFVRATLARISAPFGCQARAGSAGALIIGPERQGRLPKLPTTGCATSAKSP